MTTPDPTATQVRNVLLTLHDEVGELLRELRSADLQALSPRQRATTRRLTGHAEKIYLLIEPSWIEGAGTEELMRTFKEILDDVPNWNALAATLER